MKTEEYCPPLEEVRSLINYASQNGLDPEGGILVPLNKAVFDYAQANAEPDKRCSTANDVIKYYSKLTKLTQPVNGHTLRDTDRICKNLMGLFAYSAIFLIIALGNEALGLWFNDMVQPEEGSLLWMIKFQRYVLNNLSPFFWGGLGACVYLMKRLTDLAGDRAFDRKQMQGWQTRILLGAILGAVIQYIYSPTKIAETGVSIDLKALAFLTGLGVKVVYGAIEKTLDVLAQKMNLSAIRADEKSLRPH